MTISPPDGAGASSASAGRTIIPVTDAVLTSVLRARFGSEHSGLTFRATQQLHTALAKTTWGGHAQRTWALLDHGAVLASAERYALEGVLDGRVVAITGIGSVCGAEAGRDAQAVRDLIEWLVRDADTPLALLFPSAAVDELPVDGFDTVPLTETVVRVVEDPRRGAPMTTMRGGETRDLQAIAAMGVVSAGRFRLALKRSTDFIQYVVTRRRLLCGLGAAHAREFQFFIAEEGITAAAYVVLTVTAGQWVVEEYGDRDPSGARLGALLQALIAREPSRERPTIRIWLPTGLLPPQLEILSTQPAPSVVRLAERHNATAPFGMGDVLYWPNDIL